MDVDGDFIREANVVDDDNDSDDDDDDLDRNLDDDILSS